jgi:hypothetical protein
MTRFPCVNWSGIRVFTVKHYAKSETTASHRVIGNFIRAHGDTVIELTDNAYVNSYILSYNDAKVIMKGNSEVDNAYALFDRTILQMSENTLLDNVLEAHDNSRVVMRDNASVRNRISSRDHATIDIYVKDFQIDGISYFEDVKLSDYGSLYTHENPEAEYIYGNITGTMEGGLEFDTLWEVRNTGDSSGADDIYIHVVPEPTTLSLITLGSLTLLRRKRK